MFKHNRQWRV